MNHIPIPARVDAAIQTEPMEEAAPSTTTSQAVIVQAPAPTAVLPANKKLSKKPLVSNLSFFRKRNMYSHSCSS